MIFGKSRNQNSSMVQICDQNLILVDNVEFLGVSIDNRLTFKLHCESIVNRLSRVCGILWRLRNILTPKIMRTIYFALAWPYVTYAITAWGRTNMTFINNLQSAQNRIMKIMYGSSTNDVFKTNKMFNIRNAYDYFAAIKLYRDINCEETRYFAQRISQFQSSHNYHTRFASNENLILPLFTTARAQKSFIYQSIIFWNSLPLNIKRSSNLKIFKNSLQLFILDSG